MPIKTELPAPANPNKNETKNKQTLILDFVLFFKTYHLSDHLVYITVTEK